MADPKATRELVLSLIQGAGPGIEGRVVVRARRSANTRFAVGQPLSNGDVDDQQTTLVVAQNGRHASLETNRSDEASLRAAVRRAVEMMKVSPPDPEWTGVLGPVSAKANPAAWDDATAQQGADARVDAAAACITAAEEKGLLSAGFYQQRAEHTFVGTTAGLRLDGPRTSASLSTTARTADGQGSGWAAAASHRGADIDAAALGRVARDKGLASQKPRSLAPGRYTVVLEPAAVADLLSFLVLSMRARPADEGRSFFSKKGGGTRVGESIWPETITLRSDAFDPLDPGVPFDDEGHALEALTWIDRGKVNALSYDDFWAKKQGKKATGRHRGAHLLGGKAASVDELVAGTSRGLLVTRFFYTRWVDPKSMLITGLTRDGVFLIEGGKVVAPVNNFRFNESPAVMLKNCDAMTRETFRTSSGETAGGLRVPALRTAEFTMASVSEAI